MNENTVWNRLRHDDKAEELSFFVEESTLDVEDIVDESSTYDLIDDIAYIEGDMNALMNNRISYEAASALDDLTYEEDIDKINKGLIDHLKEIAGKILDFLKMIWNKVRLFFDGSLKFLKRNIKYLKIAEACLTMKKDLVKVDFANKTLNIIKADDIIKIVNDAKIDKEIANLKYEYGQNVPDQLTFAANPDAAHTAVNDSLRDNASSSLRSDTHSKMAASVQYMKAQLENIKKMARQEVKIEDIDWTVTKCDNILNKYRPNSNYMKSVNDAIRDMTKYYKNLYKEGSANNYGLYKDACDINRLVGMFVNAIFFKSSSSCMKYMKFLAGKDVKKFIKTHSAELPRESEAYLKAFNDIDNSVNEDLGNISSTNI